MNGFVFKAISLTDVNIMVLKEKSFSHQSQLDLSFKDHECQNNISRQCDSCWIHKTGWTDNATPGAIKLERPKNFNVVTSKSPQG